MKNHYSAPLHFLLIGAALLTVTPAASAGAVISYQGKLTDAQNLPAPDSTYSVDFILYTDSVGGSIVWAETASITTSAGLFANLLGSISPFSSGLFIDNSELYLGLRLNGDFLLPRSRLSNATRSMVSANLQVLNQEGQTVIETDAAGRRIRLFDTTGAEKVVIGAADGDSSVILPESAVNAEELLNEPGLAASISIDLVTLTTNIMTDLGTVTIETPEDGYIVLHGKCYLLLSGTTGANTALVQIDENEGGTSQFPYYTIAGLSGYVNSGTNYFPAYVTRIYFKTKGVYTFRLEGRANYPLPATAQSWDHVLIAMYYPTSYQGVEAVVNSILPGIDRFELIESRDSEDHLPVYKIDLRQLEIIDK